MDNLVAEREMPEANLGLEATVDSEEQAIN